MAFDPKTPYLTVDGIVELYDTSLRFQGIVLIKRKHPPFGLALPGGFVDRGERVENALGREMKEEIGLDVKIISLLGIYSDPQRDLRLHTASVVYVCMAIGMPKAGDDAKEVQVVDPQEIEAKELCFDHAQILQDYLCMRKQG